MPKLTPVHYEKLIKLFELNGFRAARKRGDHIMMTKPGVKRPVVIKTSPKKWPSREGYFELLEKV